jgi:hypothetical protein
MSEERALVPYEVIERRILLIRGQKVMLDEHLADLYGVTTGNLNKAVRRNSDRFPPDFMFPLTDEESKALRFHFGIPKPGRGGRRSLPCVFTEQGVAMLSSVLRSPGAVTANIEIMRAFVRMRELVSTHEGLARKLLTLEKKYDVQFRAVFDAIRALMKEGVKPKKPIGFGTKEAKGTYRKGK